jgi:membrane-bound lytic murein transglycosylase A
MTSRRGFFILILIFLALTGCVRSVSRMSAPPVEPLSLVSAAEFNFADDLDFDSLDLAIERSLHYYDGPGRDNVYRLAGALIGAAQLKESLLAFRQIINDSVNTAEKNKKIKEIFAIYRAAGYDGCGEVLFTGYYVPMLFGSLTRSEKYKYPLYGPPPDIAAGMSYKNKTGIDRMNNGESVVYYTRKEIDVEGVLQGKNLEIVWVSDPVDLFFLHIQGSGEIMLEDGTILTISAIRANGRPFRSITKHMLDTGVISGREASYFNVKRILKEKSEREQGEILSYNERYIFFHFVEKPTGSLGEPVTAGRTIATDPEIFPPGALAFIRLRKPVSDQKGNLTGQRVTFSRFVLNQDKGSAIKGPGRVDLFCGFGTTAESIAGSLKEKGELYFLIKK